MHAQRTMTSTIRGTYKSIGKSSRTVESVVKVLAIVAHLTPHDEALEALREAGRRAVPLGERAHDLRVVHDERRVHALRLDELADELVEQTRRGARRRAFDFVLDADGVELAHGLCGGEHAFQCA